MVCLSPTGMMIRVPARRLPVRPRAPPAAPVRPVAPRLPAAQAVLQVHPVVRALPVPAPAAQALPPAATVLPVAVPAHQAVARLPAVHPVRAVPVPPAEHRSQCQSLFSRTPSPDLMIPPALSSATAMGPELWIWVPPDRTEAAAMWVGPPQVNGWNTT